MSDTEHQRAAHHLIPVIDDDQPVRTALANLLCSAGYATRSFDSAEAFLASDCVHTASCAITDIRLKAMSGFALKEHLAQRQINLPILFISGEHSAAAQARADGLGAVAFLTKPINADILLLQIKRITTASGDPL